MGALSRRRGEIGRQIEDSRVLFYVVTSSWRDVPPARVRIQAHTKWLRASDSTPENCGHQILRTPFRNGELNTLDDSAYHHFRRFIVGVAVRTSLRQLVRRECYSGSSGC